MLFDSSRHGKYVGIKNDVLSRKTDLINQKFVGSLTNFLLALQVVCLALLIKAGADLNIADNNGRTPLSVAAARKNDTCVEILKKAVIDGWKIRKLRENKYSCRSGVDKAD